MQTLKLKFNKAAVALIDDQPGQTITLLDALSGQLGTVVDVEIVMNVSNMPRPAIPFVDQTKVDAATAAPVAPVTNGNGAPAPAPAVEEAAAPKAPRKSNGPIVHKITKGTKIAIMMKALTRTKKVKDGYEYVGITRSDLAEKMGQVENSPTAYLYSYPKKFGCTLDSEVRADGLRYYWANVPENVSFEYV